MSYLKAREELFIFLSRSVEVGGDSMSMFLVINFIKYDDDKNMTH